MLLDDNNNDKQVDVDGDFRGSHSHGNKRLIIQ